jgi:hypothetical protein
MAGQTVTSTYYCDVLWRSENMRRLRLPKLWRPKKNKSNGPVANLPYSVMDPERPGSETRRLVRERAPL